MADLIDRKAALDALNQLQYWNPEDRFRAVQAVQECPAVETRKSADEMFREMGFSKTAGAGASRVYERVNEEGTETINFYGAPGGAYVEALMDGIPTGFIAKEILTIAQLIRELEADSK